MTTTTSYGHTKAEAVARHAESKAFFARVGKMFAPGGIRRPAEAPITRDYIVLHNSMSDESRRANMARSNEAGLVQYAEFQQAKMNDTMVAAIVKGADTQLYFLTERFCALLEATEDTPVTDLSALATIGNHCAVITFERNIDTGMEHSAVCAVAIGSLMLAGVPKLYGTLIHEDSTLSTFVTSIKMIESADYVEVLWGGGVNYRHEDTSGEFRMLNNLLALLAQARDKTLLTQTVFNHYTKAEKAEVKHAHRRKLSPVNVVNLATGAQREMRKYGQAQQHIERDFCWPVKGFLRRQPYGPGHKLRRLTYIQPSIRGNLDGPLIAREQVYRV